MCFTPDTASDIAKTYKSKSDFEAARRPLWLRTYAHYWANTGSCQYTSRTIDKQFMMFAGDKAEQAKDTEIPEWYKPSISDAKIKTIEIELPSDWDSLAKARGCRPLKDFCLK